MNIVQKEHRYEARETEITFQVNWRLVSAALFLGKRTSPEGHSSIQMAAVTVCCAADTAVRRTQNSALSDFVSLLEEDGATRVGQRGGR